MSMTYEDVDWKSLLIKHYLSYDLEELDVMVLFVSDMILKKDNTALLTRDILSNYMKANKDDLDQSLSKLIKKGFIKIETEGGMHSSLGDLQKRLFDDAIKDLRLLEKNGYSVDSTATDLINDLEQLQGKTLSPLDKDQVSIWLKEGADEGMIKEACNRSITKKGLISFRQADSLILAMKRSQSRKDIGTSTVNEDTKKKEELVDLFKNADWTYHGEN